MVPSNSTAFEIDCMRYASCFLCPGVIPFVYWKTRNTFEVPNNSFALVRSCTGEKIKTEIYVSEYMISIKI